MAGRTPEHPAVRERISTAGIHAQIWVRRQFRRLLRPGSWVAAGAAGGYAICTLLKEAGYPAEHKWAWHSPLGQLLLTLGLLALVTSIPAFIGLDRALRRSEQDEELYESCRALWHLIVARLDLDMAKVGVHVWTVKGFLGFRYLDKRMSFIIETRRSAHVIWRRGKGAIGVAWADGEPVVANVEVLRARAPTARVFEAIAPADRFGLTWREFRRSRHYLAILALPLRRPNGRIRGCVSVDVRVDGAADLLDTVSQDDQVQAVLAVCEAVLAGKR